jgi:hypothetical protein
MASVVDYRDAKAFRDYVDAEVKELGELWATK